MNLKTSAIVLSLAGTSLSAAGQASLDTIFSDDFEHGLNQAAWTGDTSLSYNLSLGTTIAGRHGGRDQAILHLTLPDLPDFNPSDDPGDTGGDNDGTSDHSDVDVGGDDGQIPERGANRQAGYVLQFDLLIIDSWDGFEVTQGLDRFTVSVGGKSVFDEFFSNHRTPTGLGAQTFQPDENDTFREGLVFNHWNDSIYRDLTIAFTEEDVPSLETEIVFEAFGLQSLGDESWALDNVRVSTTDDIGAFVPAPSALMSVAGGLVLTSRRRRQSAVS